MKIATVVLILGLILLPAAGFAHGDAPRPSHGGQIQEVNDNWVELVISKDEVSVYVFDHQGKPIRVSDISGTATVLISAKPYKVELTPAGEDVLKAKLPVPATGKLAATLSLKMNGKPGSARFTIAG